MKIKKFLFLTLVAVLMVLGAGCSRQSTKVSYNVSKEADLFNVIRRVAIINVRTDKVEFEVIGRIAIRGGNPELEIIVETDEEVYKKHLVNMTEWNMYIVEDIGGAEVNKYQYEINYMPESIVPVTFTTND